MDYNLYIIIAEAAVIAGLLLWFLLFRSRKSQIIGRLKLNNKDLKKQLATQEKSLNKANAELKQLKVWYEKNKYLFVRQEQKSQRSDSNISQENTRQSITNQIQYQYLQEAYDGKFLKLFPSLEKCFFRTWAEGGTRYFEFCGNIAKALANINAIFDDVCEIEGKRSGATDIENVSAGTLDSELRITSKAKIRLK